MNPLVSYPIDKDTPVSHLPFSPAVRVGDLIFVSGQASVDATGKIVADTFEGEFRRSVENLRKVLETAGSDLQHVVQMTIYVSEMEHWDRVNKVYAGVMGERRPARAIVPVNPLHFGTGIEIQAIAAVREAL